MGGLEIRKLSLDDISDVASMIESEWKFSVYSKDHYQDLCSWYALHCLSRSSFAFTALIESKVVGVLLFSIPGKDPICCSEPITYLQEKNESADYWKSFMHDVQIQREEYLEIIRNQPDTFGELNLLMVSPGFKNHGIGKALLNLMNDILNDNGCPGLLFYTDSECNYGFYDHIGCELIGVRRVVIHGFDDVARGYIFRSH